MTATTTEETYKTAVKPLQTIPYSEKVADNNRWAKQTIEYYLGQSQFNLKTTGEFSKQQLYDVYNNKLDKKIFEYVTNPLGSNNEKFKSFPAKLRAYNIIRPSIDLLVGEWNKKPFRFDVLNLDGDDVFNSFQEKQIAVFKANVTQRVINTLNEIKETTLPSEEVDDPKTTISSLNATYKDNKAIDGFRSLKVLEMELSIREKLKDLFKDFLISGDCFTKKEVQFSEVLWDKLSTKFVDYGKGTFNKNVEDGEWATAKFRVSVADMVEIFYEDLKETQIKDLESQEYSARARLYVDLTGGSNTAEVDRQDKRDLYYCTWKSRRKMGILTYTNPLTNEQEQLEVDEVYIPDKEKGEFVEWMWINEVWDGWAYDIGTKREYLRIGPAYIQRNELNNFASCKLGINGRRFSDTESDNVSIAQLGMPYQIMYIILMYRIEMAIAKSKGTVVLLDKNTIPDIDENGESETMYYAEALGYMLLDRSGDDVDRGWNQYQKIDFSQFNIIKQLIELAMFFKQEWDDLLGINRQRKGQIEASDGLGTTQVAAFRSTVVSDIIFSTFDEFVQSELQGLLDISKFAWIEGKKAYYRNDDGRIELFNLDPTDHTNASYGVFVDSMSRTSDKLDLLKAQINAVAQRKDAKLSTIADLIFTDSYAEIKAKLKEAEALEAQLIQAQSQREDEREELMTELKKEYDEFKSMLTINEMNAQEDRLDNREYIKAQVEALKVTPGAEIDINAIEKNANDRLKLLTDTRTKEMDIASKERIAHMKDITEKLKIKASLKNKVVGEK